MRTRDDDNRGHAHGPSDPILLGVAFATERHARLALATMAERRELVASADVNACGLPQCDLVLLDINTRHAARPQVRTLIHGLHGVVVRDGHKALAPCFPKRDPSSAQNGGTS